MNLGNPTRCPRRSPERDFDQFSSAWAASTIPDRKACIDTSRHHGAASSFTWFQSVLRRVAFHDTAGVKSSWDTPASRSARRVSRFSFTVASTQLYANRRAPQYDMRSRSSDGDTSRGNTTARVTNSAASLITSDCPQRV